jgi:CheY-like chemotaxis protein
MATILLVEDDALVREVLSSAIESKGHTVVTAANGVEGLNQFAQRPFDLVISDIIMPDMEGIGMIREMRRKNPDVKIVAISGGGRTGNLDFLDIAKKLGASAIMKKPIRTADIYSLLDDCLREKCEPAKAGA